MKIVCVDDETLALNNIKDTLLEINNNYEVITFKDPNLVINYIKENNDINLCFLDIEMYNVDGISLGKQIKELNKKIKIIYVTGYSEYGLDALKIHADGYILKPIDIEEVRKNLDYFYKASGVLQVKCFGNFSIKYQGEEVYFKRSKSKELVAYLIDRKGASASTQECIGILYEDRYDKDIANIFASIAYEAKKAFSRIGLDNVIINTYNSYAINTNLLDCDYYKALQGDKKASQTYTGEYLLQYSWAEMTNADLGYLFKK